MGKDGDSEIVFFFNVTAFILLENKNICMICGIHILLEKIKFIHANISLSNDNIAHDELFFKVIL